MFELKVERFLILTIIAAVIPELAFSSSGIAGESTFSPSDTESFYCSVSGTSDKVEEGIAGNTYAGLWTDTDSIRRDIRTQTLCYSSLFASKNENGCTPLHYSENNCCRSFHGIAFYCRFQT